MRKATALRLCTGAAALAVASMAGLGTSAGAGASTRIPNASDSCWKTAVTASSCGGMSALIAAAKAEGQLTVTTDPKTWANYGNIITTFEKKYGIKILDTNPNGTSADEINEVNLDKGKNDEPDVLDMSVAFAQQAVSGVSGSYKGPILAKYKTAEWSELPASWKNPHGYWAYDYAGVVSIGYNASAITTPVTTWQDLLKPEFSNAVGLDNNPTSSGAGFGAVMAASIDNGGSLSNVQPGIAFFKSLKAAGNFNPIEAGGAGDAPMADKSVLATVDWTYNELSWKQELAKSPGIDWKIVIPKGQPYAAYYAMAISRYSTHPAAARLWEEFLYSSQGQNMWAEGGAVPSTFTTMEKDGTVSSGAKASVPKFTQTPAIATPDEVAAATATVQQDWASAVG
jgi:putative spermidine/putrescine transport system substrate-binding protein